MNKNTLKITTGAAVIAIFALLLLLNRQTAGLFEEIFLFVFPLPMVVYSAQYDWKSSLPVLVAMTLFAFFFGTFTVVFYAFSQALIGLVLGSCICRKVDMTKTMFTIMIMASIVMVLDTIVLAGLFGMDLNAEIDEMQAMINEIFRKAGMVLPENLISTSYLKQMMVIAMAVTGILQGYVICKISQLLLRRLHFQVERPKSIYLYFPPKGVGYAALVAFLLYYWSMVHPMADPVLQDVLQAAGIVGNLFLEIFGFIAIMFFVRIYWGKSRWIGILFCLVIYMFFPIPELVIGFIYVATNYHRDILINAGRNGQ